DAGRRAAAGAAARMADLDLWQVEDAAPSGSEAPAQIRVLEVEKVSLVKSPERFERASADEEAGSSEPGDLDRARGRAAHSPGSRPPSGEALSTTVTSISGAPEIARRQSGSEAIELQCTMIAEMLMTEDTSSRRVSRRPECGAARLAGRPAA